jgi:hypothetical protein
MGSPPLGTADPKDGVFAGGSAITSVVTVTSGNTVTTTTTYAGGSKYIYKEEVFADGRKIITQTFMDAAGNKTKETVTVVGGDGDSLGGTVSPPISPWEEPASAVQSQRESWRELTQ